ncbi:hypothetical protein BD310DRAFT_913191 [Dichomitus squalens]|uniref:Uncharacterized protein n=1 Tax=Dichomitus squalens TaxID=114155 RepID=A0A4Q9QAP4_9APHY|nr:hypothetical protein BD310DRAFT_913191 [Dichomitus squalens]
MICCEFHGFTICSVEILNWPPSIRSLPSIYLPSLSFVQCLGICIPMPLMLSSSLPSFHYLSLDIVTFLLIPAYLDFGSWVLYIVHSAYISP